MKMLIVFLVSIFSTASLATGNYFPVGKSGAKTVYRNLAKCQQVEGSVCYDITKKDLRFHVVQAGEVDDLTKPILKTNYNVTACDDVPSCQASALAKTCGQGDYAAWKENSFLPGYSVYCTGIEGYEKKLATDLVLDAALQAQVMAEDGSKQLLDSAINQVKKAMHCGKQIQAIMAIRNIQKGLLPAQVKSFMETYATVKSLLDSGALVTAKAEIEAMTPDGTITTQADKTAIIAELNKCIQ